MRRVTISREVAVQEIGDAQAAAVHLVGVGRADAAFGGADLAVAEGGLAGGVELLVEGKHDVAAVGNEELVRGDDDALAFESFDLRRPGRSGSSTTPLPITLILPSHRMPEGSRWRTYLVPRAMTVWPALLPPWPRTTTSAVFGQVIDDLAFAFVSPLETGDDGVHEGSDQ